MPQSIELPNGEILEFPDDMADNEISSAIQKSYPEFAQAETAPQEAIETAQPIEQPQAQPDPMTPLMQKLASGEKFTPRQNEALAELIKRGKISGESFSTMGIPGSMATGESMGAKGLTREAMPMLRPALEITPAVATGIAGTAGGPLGQAAGGALGYAAGKTVADRLEQWSKSDEGGIEGLIRGKKQGKMPIIEELGVLGDDLVRGLTFEFGGAAVAPILGALLKTPGFVKNQIASRFPAMSEKEIEKRAAAIIEANTGANPQYLKNIEASQEVVEEIPGFKATMGDISNDPGLIKLQRGLETQPGIASEKELFKRAENIESIQSYLKEQFPGNQGIDNVLEELTKQKTALGQATGTAEKTALAARGKVTPEAPQATGVKVMEELEAARKPVRAEEKRLWDKVPDYQMGTSETQKTFEKLASRPSIARDTVKEHFANFKELPKTVDEMHVFEQELNSVIFDPNANKTVQSALGKVKTALSEDFRVLGEAAEQGDFATYQGKVVHPKQLTKELDEVTAKLKTGDELTPDKVNVDQTFKELSEKNIPGIMKQVQEGAESYADRIAKTYKINFKKDAPMIAGKEKAVITNAKARKAAIEETLAGSEDAVNAATAYKEAKAYSASQNFDRFGKGVVSELRQSGKHAGGTKIPAEARPKKLMSVDSADQFIKAVGKEKAGDIMIRHYADDMMNSVKYDEAGQLQAKSLSNWVNKNKRVLDRYGIKNYFDNVDTAHNAMANAQKAQKQFDNSIASKMLDSDPQNVIARAFTGGEGISAKNTGDIMRNIMRKMGKNKVAIRGLENSFQDFMYQTMKTTAKSMKGDDVLSNATLAKAMRRFKPAMSVLYKGQPGKIKALQTIEKAIAVQNRTAKAPIGGGSDTMDKANAVANVIGTIVSHTPGINYGFKLAKLGLGGFKNLNIKETNDMVSRMLHDPKLAQIIIRASKKNPNIKKVSADINKYMIVNGLRQATSKKENK